MSNFENDSTAPGIEPGPNAIAHNMGGMAEAADFFLRIPTLTASNLSCVLFKPHLEIASNDEVTNLGNDALNYFPSINNCVTLSCKGSK